MKEESEEGLEIGLTGQGDCFLRIDDPTGTTD